MARIVREAVISQMPDLPVETRDRANPSEGRADGFRTKLRVRFTPAQALRLTAHARAAGVTKGDYIASLMDGSTPPADPARLVGALTMIADRLATFSVDLSRIARRSDGASLAETQALPRILEPMRQEVREMLVVVAGTLQQLTHGKTSR